MPPPALRSCHPPPSYPLQGAPTCGVKVHDKGVPLHFPKQEHRPLLGVGRLDELQRKGTTKWVGMVGLAVAATQRCTPGLALRWQRGLRAAGKSQSKTQCRAMHQSKPSSSGRSSGRLGKLLEICLVEATRTPGSS